MQKIHGSSSRPALPSCLNKMAFVPMRRWECMSYITHVSFAQTDLIFSSIDLLLDFRPFFSWILTKFLPKYFKFQIWVIYFYFISSTFLFLHNLILISNTLLNIIKFLDSNFFSCVFSFYIIVNFLDLSLLVFN